MEDMLNLHLLLNKIKNDIKYLLNDMADILAKHFLNGGNERDCFTCDQICFNIYGLTLHQLNIPEIINKLPICKECYIYWNLIPEVDKILKK